MLRNAKYVWSQVPLFRLIWPFVGGIICAIFYPEISFLFLGISLAVLLLIAYSFLRRFRQWSGAFLMLIVFSLGYVHTTLLTDRLFDDHYSKSVAPTGKPTFMGEIVSDPIARTKSIKLEVSLSHITEKETIKPISGRILVYLQVDSLAEKLHYGDILAFNARLNPISAPRNPAEFNYQRYMYFHQISHQAYLRSIDWKRVKQGAGILRLAHRTQKDIIHTLQEHGVNDRELAIVAALLVGYKHHLSTDQVSAFASAGAMHVLAVSGLHVGIIFLILNMLFKPLLKARFGNYFKAVVLLLALWGYAAITGLSPSVTRACTMFSFVIVGQIIHRHTTIFNAIATSAVFLLILNPFYIVEVGFQLSYLAVLGIVLLQPRIYDFWKPKYWLIEKVWAITAVSIAAQLATFPLGLLYFHQFPNYFLLSNLVVIPAATVILSVGIALITFQWVPLLSIWWGYLLYVLVHWLDLFIAWVEQLPWALIQGVDIGIGETYLLYFLVTALSLFVISKSYRWLPISLILLCVIEVANINETLTQRAQSKMVIYCVKGHTAIDLIDGKNHVFNADSALMEDFDKMRFHIHHNWWKYDLNDPTDTLPGLLKSDNILSFNGQSMVMMSDSNRIVKDIEADILLIMSRTLQHPLDLLNRIRADVVVLSQNLDWKTMSYWENELEERGLRYWNMKDKGAFEVQF